MNYGNQAGGGTVHYGAVSWRFHDDDFRVRSQTIERYGASAIPEDCSVIDWPIELRRSRALLRSRRIRSRRVRQGRQSARDARSTAATCSRRRASANIRCRRCSSINSARIFEEGAKKLGYHPFSTPRAIISQPYNGRPGCSYCGFCSTHRLPRRREVVDPRHQDSRGRRHRQLQARHRRDVLPRQQRQQRTRDGRVVLRPRRLRQHDRGRSRHPLAVHLRRRAAAAALEDRANFPTGSPIRAVISAGTSMTHIGGRVFVAFDDRYVNMFMGPTAQKHTIDDSNADNFDHSGPGLHPRCADLRAGRRASMPGRSPRPSA